MKTFNDFKKQISVLLEEDELEKKAQDTEEAPKEPEDSEDGEDNEDGEEETPSATKGEWTKTGSGWNVRFKVNGQDYTVVFSPLDENEQHWKYIYFKTGQRNSSDIKKFGSATDWPAIWSSINEITKNFLRVFRPLTLKFIGMTVSKRQIYYRELFKLWVRAFLNYFRSMGYQSSFDTKDLNLAPTLVIKKRRASDKEDKE